jgi:hypothetical protein
MRPDPSRPAVFAMAFWGPFNVFRLGAKLKIELAKPAPNAKKFPPTRRLRGCKEKRTSHFEKQSHNETGVRSWLKQCGVWNSLAFDTRTRHACIYFLRNNGS